MVTFQQGLPLSVSPRTWPLQGARTGVLSASALLVCGGLCKGVSDGVSRRDGGHHSEAGCALTQDNMANCDAARRGEGGLLWCQKALKCHCCTTTATILHSVALMVTQVLTYWTFASEAGYSGVLGRFWKSPNWD
jgi:hypothetical protein